MVIDWAFIGSLEGRRLVGYVPDPAHSKSGVTVATGVDLGHMTDDEFHALSLDLQDAVEPYRGLVGRKAVAALHARPLMITSHQADALDALEFTSDADFVRSEFDRCTHAGAFDALPAAAQTVIASVGFQYGNPARKCPHFWASVVAEDWARTVELLEHSETTISRATTAKLTI